MPSYYNRVSGNLYPGKIAKSDDIHLIQTNIEDALKSVINDMHDHTSYILGEDENAFLLTPAPRRTGRYIDTMNLVTDSGKEKWLSIRQYGYKQAIKKSKSSLYSVILKLRNLYKESVILSCQIVDEYDHILSKANVTVPGNTVGAEFEVIFDIGTVPTAPGRPPEELEKPDVKFMALPPKKQEANLNEQYERIEDFNNFSIGSTQLYLVVKPLNISLYDLTENGDEDEVITDDTFQILADAEGKYGRLLQQTGDGGQSYEDTIYDLYFKDVYATTNTYLCTGGMAVIDGQPVKCMDTHISIDGASTYGNVKSYIYMNNNGRLQAQNSSTYFNVKDEPIVNIPPGVLPIGVITTYVNDIKNPIINQDDTDLRIRPRSHHERLRRLEKEMSYQRDITIPPRLKYILSGIDLVDTETKSDTQSIAVSNTSTSTQTNKIEPGDKYFLTTDSAGNFVIKAVDAEVSNIDVTFKGEQKTTQTKGIELAQIVSSNTNIDLDTTNGVAKLKTDEQKNTSANIGLTDDEAKLTTMNPWDDNAENRPKDKTITPTEREFIVDSDKTGKKSYASEFPAMTFYTKDTISLKSLTVPITKFKNIDTVTFYIWKRQGPNNKTNTVWLEKRIFKSEAFSLKDAKDKDGYQVLDDPFTINITDKDGLELKDHQYVLMVVAKPKDGKGSVFVETYKPEASKDFLIRYHGSGDASHFLLKDRYYEIWYDSAIFTGTVKKYNVTGEIISGEARFDNEEPIKSLTVNLGKNEIPDGCTMKIYGDAGSDWKELTPNKITDIVGGTSSFKWKIAMTGDGSNTPTLSYDTDKKYAVQFVVTRKKPDVGGYDDSNECITTKTFYPGDILQKYIGDDNLDTTSKFSNYEFLRLWGEDSPNSKLICDIAASNIRATYKDGVLTKALSKSTAPESNEFDIFSFYYCDLTLNDFARTSVDYSNYTEDLEYDEHNLRLKIDTDKSYNDNDVALYSMKDMNYFVPPHKENESENEQITYDTIAQANNDNRLILNASQGETVTDNELIWKIKTPNYHTLDLTKYSGIKISYELTGSQAYANGGSVAVQGLGLYISSAYEEECPTNDYDLISEKSGLSAQVIQGTQTLPDTLNMSEAELIEKYYGKIIKVNEVVNDTIYNVYYQYVKDKEGNYVREQIHDLKSFSIFELPDFLTSPNGSVNNVVVSIDAQSESFKNVKEIGLIKLAHTNRDTDNNSSQSFNVLQNCQISFKGIKSIAQGYDIIFDGTEKLTPYDSSLNAIKNHYYIDNYLNSCRIKLYYNKMSDSGEIFAYINNDSITTNFNHFAIQLAADCWIPKNTIKVNLCTDTKGKNPVFSLNVPTLNYVFYDANESDTYKPAVNFSQIFKRINDEFNIKSISLSTTDNFRKYMNKIRGTDTTTDADAAITIFVKNMVLHEADTIPLFHPNIRMKIYGDSDTDDDKLDSPSIRKIGSIIQYS